MATQDISIWNEENTKAVDVITDTLAKNRLAVDSVITGFSFGNNPPRVSQPVRAYTTFGTGQSKATYTVPANKVLYIQTAFVSLGDVGGTITVELQAPNGTGQASFMVQDDGTSHATTNWSDSNPLGSFTAGTTIRLYRVGGDSGKDWAGGWSGYLEDA